MLIHHLAKCFSNFWLHNFHHKVINAPKRMLTATDPRPTNNDVCTPAWCTKALEVLVAVLPVLAAPPADPEAVGVAVGDDNPDPRAAVATVNMEPNTDVTTPAPEVARVKSSPPSEMTVTASPPIAVISLDQIKC
jgi:hypothetical protein